MQRKNLRQLFFIFLIGFFGLNTNTLFCPQGDGQPDSFTGVIGRTDFPKAKPSLELEDLGSIPKVQSFYLPSSNNPKNGSFQSIPPSPASAFHTPLSQTSLAFTRADSRRSNASAADVEGDLPQLPPSRTSSASLSRTLSQSSSRQPNQAFSASVPLPAPEGSVTSNASLSLGDVVTNDSSAQLKKLITFLDPVLVLAAQLGKGSLNPGEDNDNGIPGVAIRSSRSILDRDFKALPNQLYEATQSNLLGLMLGGDQAGKNPEPNGIFGHQKSQFLQDSKMHKYFQRKCQELAQQFNDLCKARFDQIKRVRDYSQNGGVALWTASHKFLETSSYLVYWSEILEVVSEIKRLCERQGKGISFSIEKGDKDAAEANTPTTTIFELVTQIAEILYGRDCQITKDMQKLEENPESDGLDTVLLVNGQYLGPQNKKTMELAKVQWSVHLDFNLNAQQNPRLQNCTKITNNQGLILLVDARMRVRFANVANALQTLLDTLISQTTFDSNVLSTLSEAIEQAVHLMITDFFSNDQSTGFGQDLLSPLLQLADVSESWRFLISTLIENNNHQGNNAKEMLKDYIDFVGDKDKYGIQGPKYKISDELEKFFKGRKEFFEAKSVTSSPSRPFANVEEIEQKNGLSIQLAHQSLFALRDQDFRLPSGVLCLNCGHTPFQLALILRYFSDPANQLYKVFFEDDPTFDVLDRIAQSLWGAAEGLTHDPHSRNTLDFVHNPQAFRCAWCRHLERFDRQNTLQVNDNGSWQLFENGSLDNLFNQVYVQGTNQNSFSYQIGGFVIIFPENSLRFDNQNPQYLFQTITVNNSASIEVRFYDGKNAYEINDQNSPFQGIQTNEITAFKLEIVRTLQDLFGAWLAMAKPQGSPITILTPSTKPESTARPQGSSTISPDGQTPLPTHSASSLTRPSSNLYTLTNQPNGGEPQDDGNFIGPKDQLPIPEEEDNFSLDEGDRLPLPNDQSPGHFPTGLRPSSLPSDSHLSNVSTPDENLGFGEIPEGGFTPSDTDETTIYEERTAGPAGIQQGQRVSATPFKLHLKSDMPSAADDQSSPFAPKSGHLPHQPSQGAGELDEELNNQIERANALLKQVENEIAKFEAILNDPNLDSKTKNAYSTILPSLKQIAQDLSTAIITAEQEPQDPNSTPQTATELARQTDRAETSFVSILEEEERLAVELGEDEGRREIEAQLNSSRARIEADKVLGKIKNAITSLTNISEKESTSTLKPKIDPLVNSLEEINRELHQAIGTQDPRDPLDPLNVKALKQKTKQAEKDLNSIYEKAISLFIDHNARTNLEETEATDRRNLISLEAINREQGGNREKLEAQYQQELEDLLRKEKESRPIPQDDAYRAGGKAGTAKFLGSRPTEPLESDQPDDESDRNGPAGRNRRTSPSRNRRDIGDSQGSINLDLFVPRIHAESFLHRDNQNLEPDDQGQRPEPPFNDSASEDPTDLSAISQYPVNNNSLLSPGGDDSFFSPAPTSPRSPRNPLPSLELPESYNQSQQDPEETPEQTFKRLKSSLTLPPASIPSPATAPLPQQFIPTPPPSKKPAPQSRIGGVLGSWFTTGTVKGLDSSTKKPTPPNKTQRADSFSPPAGMPKKGKGFGRVIDESTLSGSGVFDRLEPKPWDYIVKREGVKQGARNQTSQDLEDAYKQLQNIMNGSLSKEDKIASLRTAYRAVNNISQNSVINLYATENARSARNPRGYTKQELRLDIQAAGKELGAKIPS